MQVYMIIGIIISLVGTVIRIIVVGYAADNTSGRNTDKQIADSINTTGLYSCMRHPLYLANYIMWLGIAVPMQNIYFVVISSLLFWLYYERIMFAEEQFLRNKFKRKLY
jgi:protein-S-isoprenylcysteine O-methyltransferase Ste14